MAKKIEEEVKEVLNNDYEEVTMEERIVNIEKKANASFGLNIVILVLVIISLVFSMGGSKETINGDDTSNPSGQETVTYDTSKFNEIAPTDIAKISAGKTVVVWVGRQSCGYCAQYAPYMEKAAEEYGITAYYIDLATMIDFSTEQAYITDADQFDTLSSLSGKGEWATFAYDNVGGTPLTLIIKDNKVIGGLSGYTDTEGITTAFKTAGMKKK